MPAGTPPRCVEGPECLLRDGRLRRRPVVADHGTDELLGGLFLPPLRESTVMVTQAVSKVAAQAWNPRSKRMGGTSWVVQRTMGLRYRK